GLRDPRLPHHADRFDPACGGGHALEGLLQGSLRRSQGAGVIERLQRVDPGAVSDADLSRLSRGLIGSEVLRIAAEIRALTAQGRPICNLTVGDFDSREFRPPEALLEGVRQALHEGHTNYPPSNGVLELRQAVTRFYRLQLGLEYPVESVLIAGGARPLI